MKNLFHMYTSFRPGRALALAGALLALPWTTQAQTLVISGTGGSNTANDVTAYVDKVELVRVANGATVAGALTNSGFETPVQGNGNFMYRPTGATWSFLNGAGITAANSGFATPGIAEGNQEALLQSANSSISQPLTLTTGIYQVRFLTTQRQQYSDIYDQGLVVTVGGVQVGIMTPPAVTSYITYTTNQFAVDASGNVTIPPNNALAFDGVNDNVAIPRSIQDDFTMEYWMKTAMTSPGGSQWWQGVGIIDGEVGGVVNDFGTSLLNGKLAFGVGNPDVTIQSTTTVNDGRWHHIAVTRVQASGLMRLYVDGTLENSINGNTASLTSPSRLVLGAFQTLAGTLYNGQLDEVRLFNTALSQANIQADRFSTNAAVSGSQVAYYNFNQGTAGGNNASVTSLNDQSGNGNTGTLTNFALTGTTSNFVRSFATITGISPINGQISSSVTVAGTNLLDATGFKFNGTAVSPFTTPTSDFSATVTVPSGTTTGPISVSSAALTAYNGPTFTVLATTAVTWTGAVSTSWATANNWNPAVVPTSAIDVTIPSGPANQPVVSGTQVAQNVLVQFGASLTLAATTAPITSLTLGSNGNGSLTLAAGSTLTQGAASELYITGDMTNNGATFALNATSEVGFGFIFGTNHILNGTAGVTFQILTVGEQGFFDDLSIEVPVQVRRKLGVYNTSTTSLGTGGSLTLLSDATGTALVENSNNSTVTGTVTVQRYIDPTTNAGLGYRHYSAPVSNTTVADLATTGFTPTLTTSYNASATPGTTTPFPTVFGYDQSRVALANAFAPFDRGFVVPAAASAPLAVGKGYAVNLTGAQLVDFIGTLNNGDLPVSLARNAAGSANEASAGWQLVGNPYPAPLDWSLVLPADRSGLDAAVYVYESASQYTGSYRANVNGVGGNANSGSPLIASGQGFFVRVSSGQTSASLTFHNSQRVTAPNATAFRRTAADPRPLVQLELRGATGPADALYAYAQTGASPAFDAAFDAAKLPNTTGLNLSSVAASGESLAIDGRPAFAAATLLPLLVGVPTAGAYSLTATTLSNLPAGLDAYLSDAATGQTVNLSRQPAYAFAVTTAQAQAAMSGRFVLRFAAAAPLATAPALTAADVTLYPNPARDQFTVLVPAAAGAAQVQGTLLNALGQTVRQLSAPATAAGARLAFDTAGLPAGVYVLRLRAGTATLAKRVVLQ